MKYLIRKEISLFFSSAMGCTIVAVWLLATSLMVWVFPGEYNIADGGYASLRPLFSLAPILFLFLVPAASMRVFAEEKRSGTLELLLFRPLYTQVIVMGKYFAVWIMMLLSLVPTLIYVLSVRMMSANGLDAGEIAGGYAGLALLLAAFVSIGIFASSLTSNQLVAFILAAILSFSGFYGFELLATLFSGGNMHNLVAELGMNAHYRSLSRGVIDSRDVFYFMFIIALFLVFSVCILARNKTRKFYVRVTMLPLFLCMLLLILPKAFIRIDLTEGRRYSLSSQSRQLAGELERPLEVVLYLNGNLNPAFDRLRTASLDMLEELSQYMPDGIAVKLINPSSASGEKQRQENYLRMDSRGLRGVSVNEHDREGKLSSKVVFPWMELVYNGDTVPVDLLKKNATLSPQEMLNVSIGDLEYGLTEGLRLLTLKEPERVAFIEGHDEFPEPYVSEATGLLSKYYHVDRGPVSGDPAELYPYKVLIIASPQTAFSEREKFALDQYLMNGGSLLFFVDGTEISRQEFDATGESATLKKELNLDDLFFNYGIRLNPVTLQDMNCTPIRVASAAAGTTDAYTVVPWFFSPLLHPSPSHPVTKNSSLLKSEQVSTISFVGIDSALKKTVLLTSSPNAHTLPVPEKVSLRYIEMPADPAYFNESDLPVAVLVEGNFTSAFRNRLLPDGAREPSAGRKQESKPARLLVAASGSLIKNEWKGQGDRSEPLPLGFEPVSGEQLGNADFLVNSVNYLAGNDRWLNLRGRSGKLRLLDKQAVTSGLLKWQLFNVVAPLGLLIAFAVVFAGYRKQ